MEEGADLLWLKYRVYPLLTYTHTMLVHLNQPPATPSDPQAPQSPALIQFVQSPCLLLAQN